jgi:hypothetical protein
MRSYLGFGLDFSAGMVGRVLLGGAGSVNGAAVREFYPNRARDAGIVT